MNSPHAQKKGCKMVVVEKDVCTILFPLDAIDNTPENRTPSPEGGVMVKMETVRGETIFLNLNKKNEILSIDLFQPGTKPCQPQWDHIMEDVVVTIPKEEGKVQ